MRIEIIGGSSSRSSTISGLHTDFDSLLTETDSVIDALSKLKSFSYNMSGGIGILQNAVGNVDSRLQAEENKKNAISSAKGKCESFLQLVSTIDSQVAETVSENKDEFYDLNKWSRPSIIESAIESWYVSAKEWIKNSAKIVADYFTHSLEVYNETDFKELSTEELRKYYEQLVSLMEQGELSNDDRTRLMSFMEYLSRTTIDNDMSLRAKARVEMYNKLYERLHPEEATAISTFFDKASKEGITSEDISNIKFIAYNSEEPAHDAFFSNIADCRVNSWNYDGGSFYGCAGDESTPGIHVNIDKSRNANDRYKTIFHELGHNIDDLYFYSEREQSPKLMTNFLSLPEFGDDSLRTTLYSELRSTFKSGVVAVNDNFGSLKLNDASVECVVDALMDGRKKYSLNPYERAMYEAIQDSFESTDTFKNSAVSDVTGGLTNNTTAGYDRDFIHLIKSGAGHARYDKESDSYYWYNGNDATGKQEAEFFAHYMEYAMTGQTDGLDALRRVYPNGTEIVENILKAGRLDFDNADEQGLAEWLQVAYPGKTFE